MTPKGKPFSSLKDVLPRDFWKLLSLPILDSMIPFLAGKDFEASIVGGVPFIAATFILGIIYYNTGVSIIQAFVLRQSSCEICFSVLTLPLIIITGCGELYYERLTVHGMVLTHGSHSSTKIIPKVCRFVILEQSIVALERVKECLELVRWHSWKDRFWQEHPCALFLPAMQGRILIDDLDIALIGLTNLRSKITIMPQDPTIDNVKNDDQGCPSRRKGDLDCLQAETYNTNPIAYFSSNKQAAMTYKHPMAACQSWMRLSHEGVNVHAWLLLPQVL
ncbi:hypothetical protein EV421DRAFT_1927579 [Armillaria borealis]|uniref:Uncharacterized protein n=1 Tax=Armillaria borealis TaxID=47425 RepID=A0AA39MF39_9AGAR|nr:hypothetical protein EV421DRAFT_1927579 [Armillaria borealis]